MSGRITKIINGIYAVLLLLFLTDYLSFVEIKVQVLKTNVYYGSLIGSLVVLVWNVFTTMKIPLKITGIAIPAVAILFFSTHLFELLFPIGVWKTQTILFTDKISGKTIEFQMKDAGTFGYDNRIVEVSYLSPFFIVVKDTDTTCLSSNWIRENRYVDELGIIDP